MVSGERILIAKDGPWRWLAAGWQDMVKAPMVSLGFGLTAMLPVVALVAVLSHTQTLALLPVIGVCFLVLGPLLATGLYQASRTIENGDVPKGMARLFLTGGASGSQVRLMGAFMALAAMVWLEMSFILTALFLGTAAPPPVGEFIPTLLLTGPGLGLLVTGSVIGAIILGSIYAATAFSLPMLIDTETDAVTALAASFKAVLSNPLPAFTWAAVIALLMGLAIALGVVGVAVVFPLIGHASWHAYREVFGSSAPSSAPAEAVPA